MREHPISDEQWGVAQKVQASNWEDKGTRESALLRELVEHSEVITHLYPFLDGRSNLTGLEVGIGPLGIGFLAAHAKRYFSRIVGLEPLPILAITVHDEALRRYATDLQSRVEKVMGRGEDLKLDDESFDITCCINVVDHAQSPGAILAEIARVTKPGGLFIFGVNTLSLLGERKWQVHRSIDPQEPLFLAHPYTFTWRRARSMIRADWSVLWEDRPSGWQQFMGHGRMSFWILRRNGGTEKTGGLSDCRTELSADSKTLRS